MLKVARGAVRKALLFGLVGSLVGVPAVAFAAKKAATAQKGSTKSAKKRVVLGAFTGPRGKNARSWAETGLKGADNVQLVPHEKAANVGSGSKEADYASLMAGTGAAALVVGRVNLQKKVGWSATLWVYNAADGKLIEKLTVRGGLLPGLQQKLETSIGQIIAPALEKSTGGEAAAVPAAAPAATAAPKQEIEGAEEVTLEEEPVETAPKAVEEEPEPEEPEEPSAPGPTGPSPLDLRLGFRFYQRSLVYSDTLANFNPLSEAPLGHQTAAGSPMFIFSANFYPVAFFTTGALAHIGVVVGYEQGFLTKTSIPDPITNAVYELDQSHTEAYLGLSYRLMLGVHEVIPFVSFGKHSFSIDNDRFPYSVTDGSNPYKDAVPDTGYSYVDIGVKPRMVFGAFSVGVRGAYRIVNDTGGLQQTSPLNPDGTDQEPYDTWFPLAKGNGLTGGVHLGYMLTDMFELGVGFDYTRYGFDFNHVPTVAERTAQGLEPIPAARVAGGATDTYVSGWLAFGIRFPGMEVAQAAETPDDVVEDPENEDVEELDF